MPVYYMEEEKKFHQPPSKLEKWLNTTSFPVLKVVGFSCVFVWVLGVLFGRGFQIYPIFTEVPDDMVCPECRIFTDVHVEIRERQFRIVYQAKSALEMTRAQSWKLLRIKIRGKYFDQEMRPVDNCGLYAMGTSHTAVHYEMNQEGPISVDLMCLDDILLTKNGTVTEWKRDTKYSIVHDSRRLTNACLSKGQIVLFTKSNVKNLKPDTYLGNNVRFERQEMVEFAKEVPLHEKGFAFTYTNEELSQMNSREIFENILSVAFTQSHFGELIMFKQATTFPSHLISIVKKVTEGKFTSEQALCYEKLNFLPNLQKATQLSVNEHNMMKHIVTRKYERLTDVIVMNSNEMGSEIQKSIGNVVELPKGDIKYIIKNVSVAKAMISYDDNNDVINAFWLPNESPLILIVPPKRTVYSEAVQRLQKSGRKIVAVEGEVEGATSNDDATLMKCFAGELDADSSACDSVYASIRYKVDINKIIDAVNKI